MAKGEKKAEAFKAFFTSIFTRSQTSCSWGSQPTKLEDRDGEKNEMHRIQGKIVSNLVQHRHTQVYETRGDPPKGNKGTGISAHKVTFNHLLEVLPNWGGPSLLQVSKCDVCFKEEPEGMTGQFSLSAMEGHGAAHLGCHHMVCTGQPGDQVWPAWVYERQILLD